MMKIEAIILYIFQVPCVLLEACIAYLALQYLKRKPLGMQTILDKVVKAGLLIYDSVQNRRKYFENAAILNEEF